MADCTDFPTPEDAKRFKNNAGSVDEFVTSDSDTFVDQDGGEHITISGIETLAENQRDQFDATFQAQFAYKRIGNISDYVGNSLPETDKLNSYQYPDDSGEWYGPIQSQTFPVTIPADPTSDDKWAAVNALTSESLGGLVSYQASSVNDMIAGKTTGGEVVIHVAGQVWNTSYYSVSGYGAASYILMTSAQYEAHTGLVVGDGMRDHSISGGLIAMLQPCNGVITVQQCGSIPYDDSQYVADLNRDAFRAAHLSLKSEWDARKSAVTPLTWTTKVESGDYNLSNGYTVPKGMVSFCDSLGAARVKQLTGTVDANPKLPTVTLGNVINGTAVESTTGLYVTAPPPKIHNLYVNPQNSNVAVDIPSVAGFTIGDLWIQADTCVRFGDNTGDGNVGRLFMEDSSSRGLVFEDCQNIIIDEVYSFLCSNPCIITGNPNNIDIGILQTNYSDVASLQTNDATNPRNFKIGRLVCNQNAQFGSFVSPIRLRSASSDIRIDRFEAYNYNGYALINETGLGNVVDIGTAILKQQRSNDAYTQGTTAKGFDTNNCRVTVEKLKTEGLQNASIGRLRGSQVAKLKIKSGSSKGQVDSTDLIEISNTVSSSSVRVTDFDNETDFALYNTQDNVEVTFSRVKNPFPVIVENSRNAVKIPFNKAGLYELTMRCNTNPSGNNSYRRVIKAIMSIEVFFDGSNIVWNAELTETFKSTAGTGFVPAVDLQMDLTTVGDGTQKTKNDSDELVFSVPSSYNNIAYQLEPVIS